MMIDLFSHILPPRYLEARNRAAGRAFSTQYARYPTANPGLTDLNLRFRVMDEFPDVRQLLTIAGPNVESITTPAAAAECARIANDELAELVERHPDRFVGFGVCLPMTDVDAAVREATRALDVLGARALEVFTDINGRALDAPEFLPVFEFAASRDVPILLHPRRTNTTADYAGEDLSKFLVYTNFGWPFETSKAMARLAFGGVFDRYPDLKVVTHHAGGLIPYFHKRVELSWDFNVRRMGYPHDDAEPGRSAVDAYRRFHCDTAIQGNTPALMCAHAFFGADHMLFATDSPYDDEFGARVYRETIPAVEAMSIPEAEKRQIFEGNARRLLRLGRAPQ